MKNQKKHRTSDFLFALNELFEPPVETEIQQVVASSQFKRTHHDLSGKATLLLDNFPDTAGVSCCFIRIPSMAQSVHFVAQGANRIESCPSGGWVLKPGNTALPSYWIPQPPQARKLDSQGRILSEEKAAITSFNISPENLSIKVEIPKDMVLDLTIWLFPAEDSDIHSALNQLNTLEKQPVFLWTSQTRYRLPADMYLYMVHGHVYVDRFIWPRMWKICSELDAYGLYIVMSGLELSTGKVIYSLLKRQLLFSVIVRQAADGGWHHGEWTDLMESHYRFHNGAMLLLQAALRERPDEVVSKSLARAAHYISCHTDDTELGLWFLHDSLEEDADMMRELCRQTGSTWIPARTLGKSPTNKLILNTHLDSIVTLEQYRKVSGDTQYVEQVSSALAATRGLLGLRPAEHLYRAMYRAIQLTLLPKAEAERLPVLVRATKRLTWKHLIPQLLPRVKRLYPRLVMPGGYIERHLSMPHYDINYHPVNVMDLVRLWRCFPEENLDQIIKEAVEAVADSSILKLWAESKPRHFSVVVWVDALYQLCTLKQDVVYRNLLAEGIITIVDAGLGLPPSLLGADTEAVKITERVACPSPVDKHLQVANLSCNGHIEILVINPSGKDRKLQWDGNTNLALSWTNADGSPLPADDTSPSIHSRKWITGRET